MGRPPVLFLLVALGCSGYCFLESRSMACAPPRTLLSEPLIGSSAASTQPSNMRRTMRQLKFHSARAQDDQAFIPTL
eukprot:3581196-Amphidinium_carterae.2